MTTLLVLLVIALAAIPIVLTVMNLRLKRKLSHFQGIEDAEAYQNSCQAKAQAALQQHQTLVAQSSTLNQHSTAQKHRVAQYQQLLGNLQSAAELRERIQKDTARVQQLATSLGNLEHATKLKEYVQGQEVAIRQKKAELEAYSNLIGNARNVTEIAAQAKYYENYLAQLKADIESVEETKSLQEFGFYRRQYNFESSEKYADRLEQVRNGQKRLLSAKVACICATEWTVEGSKAEGKKMVDQQIKLMLRAFNGECDAAISKVRYNNAVSLQNRIRRSFEQINKLGQTQRICMSPDFFNLKIDELHLSHEHQQVKQEEREEQRLIREQMREEEKAAREIDKACDDAARQEELKLRALEAARAELALTTGRQTAKLEGLVARLENELHDAIDRKAKAIARAQLTKSGHVYILSNIGTFGDGVYKIGMSRRLEPLDRVDELGGASVPFPFDVHAMIYSENAPELECALHRHFASRRVNMINLRREFFRVTLDEIRAAVAQYFGQVTFVLVPEAEQFRQTVAMLKDIEQTATQLQIA